MRNNVFFLVEKKAQKQVQVSILKTLLTICFIV